MIIFKMKTKIKKYMLKTQFKRIFNNKQLIDLFIILKHKINNLIIIIIINYNKKTKQILIYQIYKILNNKTFIHKIKILQHKMMILLKLCKQTL